jgi:hypothetical protein
VKRVKDEAGKMETVRVSEVVLAKINEAKRFEEDPGQPLSAVSERIELLLAKYKADQNA